MEKSFLSLKAPTILALVLVLALGVFLQLQLLQKNKPLKKLRDKFAKEYSVVMSGQKPPTKEKPVTKLKRELNRIRAIKSGKLSTTGEKSAAAKLTTLLKAFNKCAAQTNLHIDSVSITARNISIVGDTAARNNKNTLKVFEAIKKEGLDILKQSLESQSGRDEFSITVAPKK